MLEDDYFIDTTRESLATSAVINSVITVRPERVLAVEDAPLRARLLEKGLGYTIKPVMPHESGIPFGNFKIKFMAIYNPDRSMRQEVVRYLELLQEELAACGYTS